MDPAHVKIGFVRRGYSPSGGAECYLKRLAQGVCQAGHEAHLITTAEWPAEAWPLGPITKLRGRSPQQFADEVEQVRPTLGCDVLMSLERVWQCDVLRAGDGVHRAWLRRRARVDSTLRKLKAIFSRKHRGILRLEESLFGHGGARCVIANSEMVKQEIIDCYGFPAEEIDVVYTGVPLQLFHSAVEQRQEARTALGLSDDDLAVVFVGSGLSRKGLKFAIAGVEACANPRMQLLVAGRGNRSRYASRAVRFLGEVSDLPALYAAADIFLLPTIYDPFSNAALEAIAAGLPVITTSGNGVAEIMQDSVHGSIIENPDDVGAISAALQFWSDSDRRAVARPRLTELAAGYDISANVARTLEILMRPSR
jgi:UDP-glucose:(heptosyl)LPS alpha-1,3-glucosyltransferase